MVSAGAHRVEGPCSQGRADGKQQREGMSKDFPVQMVHC